MQNKSLERIWLSKRLIFSCLGWHRYLASRLLTTSSLSCKNYYEVLGLQRDCTATEIKESFIRLSKEVHPDKNPESPGVHQKFVLLNEAYSVLSRPQQRSMYDAELYYQEHARMHNYGGVVTDAPREKVIFKDDSLWESRDRSEDKKYEGQPYYGIRGIQNRLPNIFIAGGAIVFMIIGAIFHFYLAKKSSAFASRQLDERDRMASMSHKMAKQAALANGNKLQMALLRQRSEASNQEK